MLLKVTADIEEMRYKIRKSKETTIRRVSNDKMYECRFIRYIDTYVTDSPCDWAKEVIVEVFEYRRKYGVKKEEVQILSMKVPLQADELYTEKTYTSEWTSWRSKYYAEYSLGDDNSATIIITFAYSPGGNSLFSSVNRNNHQFIGSFFQKGTSAIRPKDHGGTESGVRRD